MDYNSLLQKSKFLEIKARSLAEGMKSGNFRSLYRGQGIEMSSVRDYIRGDDIRAIDWNITARMGRPYVKVFEEQRELQIFLVIDNSLSMQCPSASGKTKYQAASEAAALLTFAAEINECPLGAVFFDSKINLALPPFWGREQTMLILSNLEKYLNPKNKENIEPGSALDAALNGCGKRLKKRSLVFILSDFRTTGFEKSLGMLAHKNDVIAVHLEDEFDEELPSIGTFTFVDAETGIKQTYPASSAKFKKAWKTEHEHRILQFSDLCTRHGIIRVGMKNTDDPLWILSSFFEKSF
ncbi:MAG: DUF58 domain-containing protein [Treponema sp.]|nr:DUF58 domain-containing protein [Treponema sp.]